MYNTIKDNFCDRKADEKDENSSCIRRFKHLGTYPGDEQTLFVFGALDRACSAKGEKSAHNRGRPLRKNNGL